jgi:hypothetical protein
VIGDSHAHQWMPAVVSTAEKDGWLVVPLVRDGCAPVSWLHDPNKPECPAWHKWAMAQASELRPDVTLIAGNWSYLGHAVAGTRAIARAMSVTIVGVRRVSKAVVVIGDPPLQGRQPVDCLLARHATMKTCSTVVGPRKLYADRAVAALAKSRSASFIDTLGWFCAHPSPRSRSYLCPFVVNRTVTHRDTNHISATYAGELGTVFRSALRRALFGT